MILTFLLAACGESDSPVEGADAGSASDARPSEDTDPDAAVGGFCSPSTCDGCCMDGVCMEGTSTDACGTGGEVCSACQTAQVCFGECGLDTTLAFDMVLLDAEVDSTKVSGASWDIGGGLPDVRLWGSTGWLDPIDSSVQDNTTSPDWRGEVVMEQGDLDAGFVGYVYDNDGIDDDFICELVNCPINPPNTVLECRVERGSDSPSEYDGPNAGCTLRYKIVPH